MAGVLGELRFRHHGKLGPVMADCRRTEVLGKDGFLLARSARLHRSGP